MMNYLSMFSGMEAASLAWHPLGWRCVAVSEIEPNACALLAQRFPDVPNLGDITQITDAQIAALGPIDVLIGGSPCQDLSIAGKRAGLSGARSSLFHEQKRVFDAARHLCGARWFVWENVPGAFSSHGGRDFAVVVGSLAGLDFVIPKDGWGNEGVALGANGLVEWSVLDAQWFGVAQRRRRVFAVLDTGDWANRPPVLLERDSVRGDSAPRRESRKGTSDCAARSVAIRGRDGTPQAELGDEVANAILTPNGGRGGVGVGAVLAPPIAMCLNAGAMGRQDAESETLIPTGGCFDVAHSLRADGFDASEDGTGRGTPLVPVAYAIQAGALRENPDSGPDGVGVQADHAYTLEARAEVQAIAFDCKASGRNGFGIGEIAPTLRSMGHADSHQNAGGQVAVHHAMQVRRLTPRECERLQGARDDWTLVTNSRSKPMADGPRYKMIGNSFAVPVIRWIGERIALASAA